MDSGSYVLDLSKKAHQDDRWFESEKKEISNRSQSCGESPCGSSISSSISDQNDLVMDESCQRMSLSFYESESQIKPVAGPIPSDIQMNPSNNIRPFKQYTTDAFYHRNVNVNDLCPRRSMPVPIAHKDEYYWERRNKNNLAAKKSRDSRRLKENEVAIRAALLEEENLKLRTQVSLLKQETAKLHQMLFKKE